MLTVFGLKRRSSYYAQHGSDRPALRINRNETNRSEPELDIYQLYYNGCNITPVIHQRKQKIKGVVQTPLLRYTWLN